MSTSGTLFSLGPSLFVLSHLGATFKIYVLIGRHYNDYVVKALQTGFSVFDYVFIPKEILQMATLKVEELET